MWTHNIMLRRITLVSQIKKAIMGLNVNIATMNGINALRPSARSRWNVLSIRDMDRCLNLACCLFDCLVRGALEPRDFLCVLVAAA